LPEIQVAPNQGKLLGMLARLAGGGGGAKRILEIGTLGGYSTIWLGRALAPGGRLISLEVEPKFAEVARGNLARAGLGGAAEVRVGKAIESLERLVQERGAANGAGGMFVPFDFVFIDADKASTPEYFAAALELSRAGTMIVVDNVIRDGAIVEGASEDASVRGMRRFFDLVKEEEARGRVSGTATQLVGVKGWDGMAVVLVTGGV
jgi:predicted O-methyltransferase YrrM